MLGIGSPLGIRRIMTIRWEADEETVNKLSRQIISMDRFKKNKMASGLARTENVITTPVTSSNAFPVSSTNAPTTMGIDTVD